MRQWYIFLLTALLTIGCQSYSPKYTFRTVGTQSNDPKGFTPASQGSPLKFKIKYKGMEKAAKGKASSHTLKFDMKLINQSPNPLSLQPNNYYLVDDEGRRFGAHLAPGESPAKSYMILPRSSLKLTLHFTLGRGYNLGQTGSFRLLWNYQQADLSYKRVTKFIKREVEYRYRNSYYGSYGFYGGWGFSSHWRRHRYGRSRYRCK